MQRSERTRTIRIIIWTVLFLFATILSGCGVVGDGVNRVRAFQLDPGELYSPEFYKTATTEKVREAVGGRSLQGESFSEKSYAKHHPGFLGDLNKKLSLFIPNSYVSEQLPVTPLRVAIWNTPYPEVVTLLLDAGSDAALVDVSFYATSQSANPAITRILLERSSTKDRCQTLAAFAGQGNREMVDACLGFTDIGPNCVEGYFSPLASAVRGGHTALAVYLFERGATLPSNNAYAELSMLSSALETNNDEMFRLLIARGADCARVDNWGRNTLMKDAANGGVTNAGILDHLARNVPMSGKNGVDALAQASRIGDGKTLDTLLGRTGGLPANSRDVLRILREALENNQTKIFLKLAALGADCSAKDALGRNGLMAAAYKGKVKDERVLALLLPAVPLGKTDGIDALNYVCWLNNAEAVRVLVNRGVIPVKGSPIPVCGDAPASGTIRAFLKEKGFTIREW